MLRKFTEHALDPRMLALVLGFDRSCFVCVCLPGLYPASQRVSVNDSSACFVSQRHVQACIYIRILYTNACYCTHGNNVVPDPLLGLMKDVMAFFQNQEARQVQ